MRVSFPGNRNSKMGVRIAFFVIIISIAIFFVFLFAFIVIFREDWIDERIKELKDEVATLQSEATQAADMANNTQSNLEATIAWQEVSFTATVQSFNINIDKVSQTATTTAQEGAVTAEKFTQLSAMATSVVATVTAQAPVTVKIKETETASLFGNELNIRLDGYSSLFSSDVTFTIQSLNSVSQTFEDIGLGEVVLYKGYKNYTILVSNRLKDEQGILTVEFVIAGN